MNYFKINYNRLENLSQINFYKLVFSLIIIIIVLIFISCIMYTYNSINLYGYYNEGILHIKINNKLSDKIKKEKYLMFNNLKTSYKIESFGEYEFIDNEIYQNLSLKLEENFKNNEVGTVKINYDKKRVIKYVLDLFK